jgi:hypothetical protein
MIKLEEINPETCNWQELCRDMLEEGRRDEFFRFWVAYITRTNRYVTEAINAHSLKIRGMETAYELKEAAERARKGAEELRQKKAKERR